MPPPKTEGRARKYCSDRCRKAAERERRAGERREAELLAHRAWLLERAAERQRAAIDLVTLITADPSGAVSAIEHDCRSWPTCDLIRLHSDIASSRRHGRPPAVFLTKRYSAPCKFCYMA
jgi:hypothetical protein